MLDDKDVVNVIIELKGTGLVDDFNENNKGYLTLSEYAGSRYATKSINAMNASQKERN